MNLYGFALDARAWDLFDLIFTEDVEAVFGPLDARLWPIDAQADCTSGCSD